MNWTTAFESLPVMIPHDQTAIVVRTVHVCPYPDGCARLALSGEAWAVWEDGQRWGPYPWQQVVLWTPIWADLGEFLREWLRFDGGRAGIVARAFRVMVVEHREALHHAELL